MDLVNIMKALGDETRLRILNLLSKGELCVCELERLLDINQSNASRHLNKLSNAGLVKHKKSALYVYYMLNNAAMEQYPFLIDFLSIETVKVPSCMEDLSRLGQYKASGMSCEDLKDEKIYFEDKKEKKNV